ncbi:type VI secretion system baseplate subunit TssG [soil metagenome]
MRKPANPVNAAAHERGRDPLADMVARPWAHDFHQALRSIEAAHPHLPRLGTARKPRDEPVRLGQAPDLSFAPSTLHAVVAATARSLPRMEVRFFGLFGPNGPLPLNLTEYARERLIHHGDETFARFADLFHHRLLLLFHRAWAQGQPTSSLDRPDDDLFGAFVGSLVGLATIPTRHRRAAPKSEASGSGSHACPADQHHAALHYAGLLSRQVRNADGLGMMLSGYLGRAVRVEQFAGDWLQLQKGERTRIGRTGVRSSSSAALGRGAVLGSTVWDRQHNFRLHIGAMSRDQFNALLPDGDALPQVVSLVEQYVGIEFGWDLRLRLKATEVEPVRLGRCGRLGWTSWLGMKSRNADVVLALKPNARPHASRHASTIA